MRNLNLTAAAALLSLAIVPASWAGGAGHGPKDPPSDPPGATAAAIGVGVGVAHSASHSSSNQNQTQAQHQSQSLANTNTLGLSSTIGSTGSGNDTRVGGTRVDAPLVAPDVVLGSPSAPCKTPAGGGIGFAGGSVGLGWAMDDGRCQGREAARMLWNMGYRDQALMVLRSTDGEINAAFTTNPVIGAVPSPAATRTPSGYLTSIGGRMVFVEAGQ